MLILDQGPVVRLCQTYLGGTPHQVEKVTGFYADVYMVTVGSVRAVLKYYRLPGQAQLEAAGLDFLRQYSHGIKIPEVIALHTPGDIGEALIMTYVSGIPASHALESPVMIDRFADECTDLLLSWHSVTRPTGFSGLDGCQYADFASSYRAFLQQRVQWLKSNWATQHLGLHLRERLIALAEQFDALPVSAAGLPTLIHDDCHAANFLVDPETQRLCGVIDPCHARFAHKDLDLFHLQDVRPDFNLLPTYLAKSPQDAGLRTRLAYFSLFDDIKHAAATHWDDEEWLWRKVDKLDVLMTQLPLVA
ncbi:phosphotransferase [Deefgea salmonis]|uniref:Phosphotransferase n=1 Tax=Deefgea salmonis TaxID=2875502 RepID=A0ABS8BKB1_9NEIS|nr:phosphotransferase [Deefgea salmonis]MCB5196163.1 phosphotransferase [Deefgea salmonis]